MRVAHGLWPRKTKLYLADRACVSPRSVERWQQGRDSLSAPALANLIRSEEGWQFLSAVMEGEKPQWWRLVCQLMGAAEAQRMQIAARRRLRRLVEEALDADRDLSAALARAEALSVSDPEFFGEHVAALRTAARLPDRPVAAGAEPVKPKEKKP